MIVISLEYLFVCQLNLLNLNVNETSIQGP